MHADACADPNSDDSHVFFGANLRRDTVRICLGRVLRIQRVVRG